MTCKFYDISDIKNKFIMGRTFPEKSPLPLFFQNSGVELNCDGSELWIDVETDHDINEPWIAYEINGAIIGRQMVLKGQHSICLYRSMVPGVVKNVRVYRETQAINGDYTLKLLVKGFRTDGNFLPVEPKKYKIEFIGDSITSGEGTYGALPDTEWLDMYASSSRQYVNMIEKSMNADCHVVSHGGFGVYISWDNNRNNNIPDHYERVCGTAKGEIHRELGTQKDWNFTSWQPDAIVINLGTNDGTSFDQPGLMVEGFGYCKMRREEDGSYNREDIDSIEKGIVDFLKMLRKHNPKAHLVWAYGMLGYVMKPYIIEAINNYKLETNDTIVNYLDLPETTPETIGSHGHPGLKDQEKAAEVIENYLRGIL